MNRSRRRLLALGGAVTAAGALAITAGATANQLTTSPPADAEGPAWFSRWQVDTSGAATSVVVGPAIDQALASHAVGVRAGERTSAFGAVAGVSGQARPVRYRLVRPSDPIPLDAVLTGVLTVSVRLRTELGPDTATSTTRVAARLQLREGQWQVTRMAGRPRELWQLGPVRMAAGSSSLVVVAGSDVDAAALADEVDQAVAAVVDHWPLAWAREVVVEVPADAGQFARLLGEDGGRQLPAVASYWDSGDGMVVRVRLNPELFVDAVPLARQIMLRHEITHAAQNAIHDPAPAWLAEGSAEYLGYLGSGVPDVYVAADLLADVRAGEMPQRLPRDADFGFTRDQPLRHDAYALSWAAVRSVVDRYGQKALFDVYAKVRDGRSVAAAIRGRLGLTPAQFTRLWQAWLRSRA